MMVSSIRSQLMALVDNLQWTWHPEIWGLFRILDPALWRKVNHNPMAFIHEMTDEELDRRADELALKGRIPSLLRRCSEYVADRPLLDDFLGPLKVRPVAYFSAEFGIHEAVPLYSGGLGVLAGDHIKSASDLGVPIVGVGLFYTEGYFRQRVDPTGWQHEEYGRTNLDTLPIKRAVDSTGQPLVISVETRGGTLYAGIWQANVGRSRLVLLDSNIEQNSEEDRALTSRLYGGDVRTRIRQELILGIGGMRALKALGLSPGVLHLNEGHSAFATLEAIRQRMELTGSRFDAALTDVAIRTLFTTHTPVEAGHDRFTATLVEEHLGPMRDSLRLTLDEFMALGQVDRRENELFTMTVLAFRTARRSNAVSAIHGHVTRRMWKGIWPGRAEAELPLGHITNGIHVSTWMAPEMAALLDQHLKTGWRSRMWDPQMWQDIDHVSPGELWETHNVLKGQLIQYVRERLTTQWTRWGMSPQEASSRARKMLRPDALTVGFARRFAAYKRADLLLRDLERLERLLCNTDRPVQIIYAGKSHPRDQEAKILLQGVARLAQTSRFEGRVIFLEDYDMGVARMLVRGVDVWLNNPRRPLEACGTSGEKAIFNGVLNCSILDGWWAEGYNGENGFAIGECDNHVDADVQDEVDGELVFQALERDVVPMYFQRGADGMPDAWLKRVKNAFRTMAWRFNSDRMVMDYLHQGYLPAVAAVQAAATDRTCVARWPL